MRLVKDPIWTTIQGEGMYTGVPSTFLRLAGCNLRCSWCDTPKSLPDYNPAAGGWTLDPLVELGTSQYAPDYVFGDVADRMGDDATSHLVITGGEPMLQQDEIIEALVKLREVLWSRERRPVIVTVETNCTITPDPRLDIDLASLSPKVHRETDERTIAAFDAWASRAVDIQVKLVIANPDEVDKALALAVMLRTRHRMRARPGSRSPYLSLQLEAGWLRQAGGDAAKAVLTRERIARMTAHDIRITAQMHSVLKVR